MKDIKEWFPNIDVINQIGKDKKDEKQKTDFIVEKDFMIDEYRCVVVGQSRGFRCGYVGLPKSHPINGVNYFQIDIEVHGELTFAEKTAKTRYGEKYPVDDEGYWLGFDCAHYMDKRDPDLMDKFEKQPELDVFMFEDEGSVKDTDFVSDELVYMVEQLKELEEK